MTSAASSALGLSASLATPALVEGAAGKCQASAAARPSILGRTSSAFGRKNASDLVLVSHSGIHNRTVALAANNDAVAIEVTGSENNGSTNQEPSAFMAEVSNLVKLVDSRDIVELELKYKNYEIVIKKKEAVSSSSATDSSLAFPPYQTFPGPHVMAHTPLPQYYGAPPPPPPMAAEIAFQAAEAPPPPVEPIKPPAPGPSPLPPMMSPMAGTFYRSPAPGEPSFVKVGDRVKKGQVVCIVEAMKLMNEIEADQSGVIIDILAEDGKPVSIDTPLFVIRP